MPSSNTMTPTLTPTKDPIIDSSYQFPTTFCLDNVPEVMEGVLQNDTDIVEEIIE